MKKRNKHIAIWYVGVAVYVTVFAALTVTLIAMFLKDGKSVSIYELVPTLVSVLSSSVSVFALIYTVEKDSFTYNVEKLKNYNQISSSCFFEGVTIGKTLTKDKAQYKNIAIESGEKIESADIDLIFKANQMSYVNSCAINHFRVIVCKTFANYNSVIFEIKNIKNCDISFDNAGKLIIKTTIDVNPRKFHEIFGTIIRDGDLVLKIKYDVNLDTLYGSTINKANEFIMHCKKQKRHSYYFSNDVLN